MISLDKQIELLAQLSIEYQYRLIEQDKNWKTFFKKNDVAVPLATLIYLKFAAFPLDYQQKTKSEIIVRKAFYDLCEALDIERGRRHLSIQDMFRNSPNPTIAEFDEETKKEIERLENVGAI